MPRVRLQRRLGSLLAAPERGSGPGDPKCRRGRTLAGVEDDLLSRARDAGYAAVGFGVLAYQRLQVRRRELVKELGASGGPAAVGKAAREVVRRTEKVVDPVLDGVERRLPGPARTSFHQARVVGRIVRHTVLPS